MEKLNVAIVGGSAAGCVAGITARRHYKEARITIIRQEKEGQVLIPCGIPYIFGTIGAPQKNIIPDALLSNNNIDLIVDEVTSIDREAKSITTSKGDCIGYEKLVLATGSVPVILPIPGANLGNVFFARKDVDYLSTLLKALDEAKDVVVIGGGFIGIEFSDEFRKRGLKVTIVEILPHCLQLVFDEDFCLLAENRLRETGVNVRTNARAEAVLGDKKAEGLQLAGGEKLKTDIVFFGVGVRPNTELAQKAGLQIGGTKGIWVDDYGRTSDKDIFAIGDCAEKRSFFTQKPSALKLASIATNEARIVGANLFELKRRNEGVIGSFATIVGGLALGQAGLTETAARDAGFDFVTGEATATDKHPGTMPDTKQLRVKLVFEKATGEILGAQICGGLTVGETTNILATLIQRRVKTEELVTWQMGTHPVLTPSPVVYPILDAAEAALALL